MLTQEIFRTRFDLSKAAVMFSENRLSKQDAFVILADCLMKLKKSLSFLQLVVLHGQMVKRENAVSDLKVLVKTIEKFFFPKISQISLLEQALLNALEDKEFVNLYSDEELDRAFLEMVKGLTTSEKILNKTERLMAYDLLLPN